MTTRIELSERELKQAVINFLRDAHPNQKIAHVEFKVAYQSVTASALIVEIYACPDVPSATLTQDGG